MQEYRSALGVFRQEVDASAIGGYPDVAGLVFYGIIGVIVAEALLVALLMAEFLDVPAAMLLGRHLKDAVVLGTEPVVALRVLRDAIESAKTVTL